MKTPETVPELIKHHHAFYEVNPYWVVVEQRTPAKTTTQRIQAGFDIDVYGITDRYVPGDSPDYAQACAAAEAMVAEMKPRLDPSCTVEVIPFGEEVFLESGSHAEMDARLRIRVTHERGLEQPAGPAESTALKEIEKQLRARGVMQGKSRG